MMSGISIGTCFFPVWFFQGKEKMGYMTFTTTLSKLLSFIPMFFVVRGPEDAIWVSVFYSIGYISASVCCICLLKKRFSIHFVKVSFNDIKRNLQDSAPYFMSRLSASLYGVGNTALLGMICGPVMAGYYDISQKIVSAFTTLISPFVTALYPYMIKSRNVKVFKKIISVGAAFGVLCFVVSTILAPFLLDILFAESNEITILTFRILCLCIAFVIPSYLLGYPFLAALGHTKFTNITVIIAGIIYIVLALTGFASNLFNIYYAASIYVFCEFFVFLSRIYGVNKYKSFSI